MLGLIDSNFIAIMNFVWIMNLHTKWYSNLTDGCQLAVTLRPDQHRQINCKSTIQVGTVSIGLSSSCLRCVAPANTVGTKFTVRNAVNLANYKKNFLHSQGVTATSLDMNSIYFVSQSLN